MPHARIEPLTVMLESRGKVYELGGYGSRTEAPTCVETGKHASAEERRSDFICHKAIVGQTKIELRTLDPPAIVVQGDDAGESDLVERPAYVPVEKLYNPRILVIRK